MKNVSQNINMKLLICILSILISLNSFSQKECIAIYGICGEKFLACRQLQLFNDSTFEYGNFMDVGGWIFKSGKWRLTNDTIVLNTFNQPESLFGMGNSNILGDYDSTLIGTKISIDPNDSIYGSYFISVLYETLFDTLSSSKPCIFNKKIERIKVWKINKVETDGLILFLNKNKNNFTITTKSISIDDNRNEYFKDLKLRIDKNGIYNKTTFVENGKEKEFIITLKKTDLKNSAFKLRKAKYSR